MKYPEDYLFKEVTVIIDKPIGTKDGKFEYPMNYGYVVSEEFEDRVFDAYVLGVFKPLKEFTGICVGIIEHLNDGHIKLIVSYDNKKPTKQELDQIEELQLKLFEHRKINTRPILHKV